MATDDLEVLVAVADELHLGRAAARCGLSTSALSKRLRTLERTVGVRLFDRTSRRVVLTPAASLLLDQAHRVLAEAAEFDALAAAASAGRAGRVRLFHQVNHARFVTELLRELALRSPRISIDFEERPTTNVAAAVRNGEASLGMCSRPELPGLSTFCFDVTDFDCIVVPRGHRLASAVAVEPEDCLGEVFIWAGMDPNVLWRERGFEAAMRRVPIAGREEFATRLETGDVVALTSSAAGVAIRHRSVVHVPLKDPSTWGHVEEHMVWRTDDDSSLVREVIAVARSLRPAGR